VLAASQSIVRRLVDARLKILLPVLVTALADKQPVAPNDDPLQIAHWPTSALDV
jgi:hypothetical protein